jgi:hypothetical protein
MDHPGFFQHAENIHFRVVDNIQGSGLGNPREKIYKNR